MKESEIHKYVWCEIMAIQGYWMGEGRAKERAHNFGSKMKSKKTGGSLRGEFLDDIKLDLNEDYCNAVG
jgi:hypothetical protein